MFQSDASVKLTLLGALLLLTACDSCSPPPPPPAELPPCVEPPPPPDDGPVPFTDDFCTRQCFCWRETLPQGLPIHDVYAPSLDDVWAVGPGTIMRFDGTSWRRALVEENLKIRAIDGRGHDDVWAVADDGSVFVWDGSELIRRSIGASVALHSVSIADDGTVWVGGDDGFVAHGRTVFEQVQIGSAEPVRLVRARSSEDAWLAVPGTVYLVADDAVLTQHELESEDTTVDGIGEGPDDSTWVITTTRRHSFAAGLWTDEEMPFYVQSACRTDAGVWFASERPDWALQWSHARTIWRTTEGEWQLVDASGAYRAQNLSCDEAALMRFGSWGELVVGILEESEILTHAAGQYERHAVTATRGGPPTTAVTHEGELLVRSPAGWQPVEEQAETPYWQHGVVDIWLEPSGTDGWIVGQAGDLLRANGDRLARAGRLPSVEHPTRIAAASRNDVLVVGENGKADHFDGSEWSALETAVEEDLEHVWMRAAGDAFVCTENDAYRWDGILFLPDEELQALRDVSCRFVAMHGTQDGIVWVVDECENLFRYDGGGWILAGASPVDVSPSSAFGSFGALWAFSADSVLVVGEESERWLLESGTWTALESGSPEVEYESVPEVWASSARDIWTASDSTGLLHWDGAAWSVVEGSLSDAFRYHLVLAGRAADDVWAHTSSRTRDIFSGVMRWDGSVWQALPDEQSFHVDQLFESEDGSTFGIGAFGRVLHWHDAYKRLDYPSFGVASTLFAPRHDDVWVGEITGWVMHYDGETWTRTRPVDAGLFSLWGASSTDMWAAGGPSIVGGVGFLAHWDGARWEQVEPPFGGSVASLTGRARGDVFAVGGGAGDGVHAIHFNGERWADDGVIGNGILSQIWLTADDAFSTTWDDGANVVRRRTGAGWKPITPPLPGVLSVTTSDDGGVEILLPVGALQRAPLRWREADE